MAIVKETSKVFFQGISTTLEKGVEYSDSAAIVKAKPALFEGAKAAPKAKKAPVKKAPKKEEIKIEEKFEAPKEELLIEEPVAALEVIEVEEPKEEVKTSRRKRK